MGLVGKNTTGSFFCIIGKRILRYKSDMQRLLLGRHPVKRKQRDMLRREEECMRNRSRFFIQKNACECGSRAGGMEEIYL